MTVVICSMYLGMCPGVLVDQVRFASLGMISTRLDYPMSIVFPGAIHSKASNAAQ